MYIGGGSDLAVGAFNICGAIAVNTLINTLFNMSINQCLLAKYWSII
jgi:hypothetical protein